jgi:hypothetical protein
MTVSNSEHNKVSHAGGILKLCHKEYFAGENNKEMLNREGNGVFI